VLAKHYRPAPYDGGPSWQTFLRHTRDSLCSIALFKRKATLPTIHSILLAIGQFTRRIIACGISGYYFDQPVVCSLFDDALVVEPSKSLSPTHDLSLGHHRWKRKLLSVGRRQTLAILPRSPPFAERRFRTRRRNHHDYHSNCSAIDLATEHEALNNYYHLFRMPNPLDENSAARINIEKALSHAESPNFARKRLHSRRTADLNRCVSSNSPCTRHPGNDGPRLNRNRRRWL
jgi:hypothetical protein